MDAAVIAGNPLDQPSSSEGYNGYIVTVSQQSRADDAASLNTPKRGQLSGGYGYATWSTNSVPTAQVIRRIFPRPSFIDPEAEVALMKNIFIDGPRAEEHELVCLRFMLEKPVQFLVLTGYMSHSI